VREDLNGSPALEIPAWMFDSSICSQMKQQHGLGYVSSAALLVLKDLLSAAAVPIESTGLEAQHLSSSLGDADAYTVTVQSPSERVVLSSGEVAAVANGSASEDGPPTGPDAERTSAAPSFSDQSGGGR
jgi:hypothetical protein